VPQNDYDMVDYLNDLREGIFEAYTGIIQALGTDKVADPHLLPYVEHLLRFISFVTLDTSRSDAVSKGAVGVLGDLASTLGPKVKAAYANTQISSFIRDMCKSQNANVKETAKWTKELVAKFP